MNEPMWRIASSLLWLGILPAVGWSATDRAIAPKAESQRKTSLLPKSLQRAPWIDVNVMTEFTKAGFGVPLPTAEKPAYYIAQSGGQRSLGATTGGENPPPVEDLQKAMVRALAATHYLESPGPEKAPMLVVVFNYGSAISNFVVPDSVTETVAPRVDLGEVANKIAPFPHTAEEMLYYVIRGQDTELNMIIERASLVGGAVFAKDLKDAIADEITLEEVGAPREVKNPYPNSPFQSLLRRSDLYRHLVEVAFHSCYFVVASAYEAKALARGERILLWRTKITVDSDGISMKESMVPLIASAASYIGVPMAQAAIVERKITTREGRVEIGEARVVEDAVAPAAIAPSTQPPPARK